MNLLVGGCSFSSPFNVGPVESYPHVLGRKCNLNVIDEARVQGSNFRIWRTLVQHIINGSVTPKDTIIVQYTEKHRQEIWSPEPPRHFDPFVEEPYDGGKLFRFKFGSDQYSVGLEKSLSKLMLRFSNENYANDIFDVQHTMFCDFLKHRGFDRVLFVKTRYCDFDSVYPVIDCDDILEAHNLDGWHLTNKGHNLVAKRLIRFIQA